MSKTKSVDNTIEKKTLDAVINDLEKKKHVSESVIDFFKKLEDIFSKEANPLIEKVKSDPSNTKNKEKLKNLFVALTTLANKTTYYAKTKIAVVLASTENIKDENNDKSSSDSEDDDDDSESGSESDSNEEDSDEDSSESDSDKKTSKKKVTKK